MVVWLGAELTGLALIQFFWPISESVKEQKFCCFLFRGRGLVRLLAVGFRVEAAARLHVALLVEDARAAAPAETLTHLGAVGSAVALIVVGLKRTRVADRAVTLRIDDGTRDTLIGSTLIGSTLIENAVLL